MDIVMRTVIGVIVAVVGILVLHYFKISTIISDVFEEQAENFREYPYKNYVLLLVVIILVVVVYLSIRNIFECVANPMCYGWPIRDPPIVIPTPTLSTGKELILR